MKITMPAPNMIENSARILPSKSTQWIASVHRLMASLPPQTLRLW